MAIVKPFKALRPPQDKAETVSCVPYDVVSDAEVRSITSDNPESFLSVTRPEADLGASDPASAFRVGRERLEKFIADGLLIADEDPCIYVYRLDTGKTSQTGLVGCCAIDDYDSGLIKKHEKTRPDKVRDRTDHMLALRAQTGLVFLAFRNSDEMRALIGEVCQTKPIYDFVCPAGVRQSVWRVPGGTTITDAFGRIPELYVADGHHRTESSSLARKELMEANSGHTGEEDYNFMMAGIFPAEDLSIMAYNRVVKDLNGLSPDQLLESLSSAFVINADGERQPAERGNFSMYLAGKWYGLRYNVNYIREPEPLERLDVEILQKNVLGPLLGIGDPRTDKRINFVGGGRGIAELEKLVNSGDFAVAFSMFPTTMEDLLAISDAGEIMPPKSTWFEPKLKDGLFVHII